MVRTPKQSLAAIAAALVLASCAAPPIARWKRENPATAAASMESAMRHLEGARGTYREAVIDQMEREAGVSSVVIGAGALVTLLAAGKAGSDAILGAAAIGGTTYALGSLNLRRQRVMVYQAGVDALDCAHQAATPFNVPDAELRELSARMAVLARYRTTLIGVANEATALKALLPATSPDFKLLDDSLTAAATTLQAASNALDAGQQFAGSISGAAGQLVATVDRIDSAVTRSLIEATPDLSSIKAQVGGMPEMIGLLAPSLQTRAAAALEEAKAAVSKSGGGDTDAQKLNKRLSVALVDAANATDSVNARLKTRAITGTPEAALKACGVAKVITDLTTDKPSLDFTAGASSVRYLEIRGGLPPYDSEFEGTLLDGVTEKLSANSNRVQVSVSNKVTGSHAMSLRISDASQPRKVMSIPVTITATATATAAATSTAVAPVPAASAAKSGASQSRTGATGATASAAIHAATILRSKNPFTHDGKLFQMIGVQPKGTVITVPLQCPGDAKKYTQDALANSLLAQAGISTAPEPAWRLKFTGACVSG